MFEEMDMAAKLQKVGTMDPTALAAPTVLRMATFSGAKVLGLENLVGSLEVGKKADIILLDAQKPHLTPLYNPYSHLVYSARGNDVTHAMINGRLVMENRRLLSMDLPEVLTRAKEKAQKVLTWVSKS
jgi:5-methylthioadenosine/S-adenosylhomocysteine deaminase